MLDVTAVQRHPRDKSCRQLSSHAKEDGRIEQRRVIYDFPSLFSTRKGKPQNWLNQRWMEGRNMENALENFVYEIRSRCSKPLGFSSFPPSTTSTSFPNVQTNLSCLHENEKRQMKNEGEDSKDSSKC
jgi:hypothetical protein